MRTNLFASHQGLENAHHLSYLAVLVNIGVPHVAFEGHGRRRVRKVGRKIKHRLEADATNIQAII